MKAQSKSGAMATEIIIQQVEIILTVEDLHNLLAGNRMIVLHEDKTSPARFHIILAKEKELS